MIGNTGQLIATIVPSQCNQQGSNILTSNNSIVTVDDTGKVTAVAAGTAIVTNDSRRQSYCFTCSNCNRTIIR